MPEPARPQHDFPVWPVAPALAVAIATGQYHAAGLLLLTGAAEEIADSDHTHEQPQEAPQATAWRAAR